MVFVWKSGRPRHHAGSREKRPGAGQFGEYDDQEISFVDHTTAILADERDVGHVFAFDSDFRTLGFSVVPADTGDDSR